MVEEREGSGGVGPYDEYIYDDPDEVDDDFLPAGGGDEND